MSRISRDTRDLPHPKPVERVELSEKHIKLRWIITILLAVLGIGLLTYSFMNYIGADAGWTVIEANSSQGMHLGSEFTFQYCLGGGEQSASRESKEITALYTQALIKAYQLFENTDNGDVRNVFYINRHPNEKIVIDETLYRAFETYCSSEDRSLYLGLIYETYSNLFQCDEEWRTFDFDPFQNPELAESFQEIAVFARDPEEIGLELLGDNTVMLRISDAYLEYADDYGSSGFIDFMWMKNAFVVDYLAEVLRENDHTRGVISSFDGFIRNLDVSGESYSLDIYDRRGEEVCLAGVMQYSGPRSIVFLRDFPLSGTDMQRYYTMSDGQTRTPYLDTRDGICRNSVHGLISYSENIGCAELALRMTPVFISDDLDEGLLPEHSVFCRENVIYHSDPELILGDLYQDDKIRYKSSCIF